MRQSVYYQPLGELAAYFLRLGVTAFGGPAVHIALMEQECVRRRRWITRERFLDVLGAANLIPGPTSTELAMHIGYARAGWPGLVVAGVCFIMPAALIVAAVAAAYVSAGSLPAIEGLLRVVKPVVVVVVLHALMGLAQSALHAPRFAVFGTVAAVLALRGMTEVLVLLLTGAANVVATLLPAGRLMSVVLLPDLFAYFIKAGSVIFGSGYVLFAIIRADLVESRRWISEAQLLDAIAVGQVTPGPVFTSATFIGYLVAGPAGAAVATVGIFLPAFFFCAFSAPAVEWLRNQPVARGFLDGVNAAAVALIVVVLFALARHAIVDVATAAVAIGAAMAIAWFRVNAAWLLLAAAAIGLFVRLP